MNKGALTKFILVFLVMTLIHCIVAPAFNDIILTHRALVSGIAIAYVICSVFMLTFTLKTLVKYFRSASR
ncbi:MAG: hypothetical protein LBT31_06830 [Synergistaceae bacterium]|jgi:ABC-type uncharacterized transport system permease subunit|nr:hypothetical protein [Synergistaceae bacterium]